MQSFFWPIHNFLKASSGLKQNHFGLPSTGTSNTFWLPPEKTITITWDLQNKQKTLFMLLNVWQAFNIMAEEHPKLSVDVRTALFNQSTCTLGSLTSSEFLSQAFKWKYFWLKKTKAKMNRSAQSENTHLNGVCAFYKQWWFAVTCEYTLYCTCVLNSISFRILESRTNCFSQPFHHNVKTMFIILPHEKVLWWQHYCFLLQKCCPHL